MSTENDNSAMYNEIVALTRRADELCASGDHTQALTLLDRAQGMASRLPIVDNTDVLLLPHVALQRAELLLDVSREDETLTSLRAIYPLVDGVVQAASDGAADLDLGAGALTSQLAYLAGAVDSGEFAQRCNALDFHQATRCAAAFPTDVDAQVRLLSAIGRSAQSGANSRTAIDRMERAVPIARWIARVAPDDVAAIANASAFLANLALMKAAAGELDDASIAEIEESIRLLDRLGDRGESAQRAESLRMMRHVVEMMHHRGAQTSSLADGSQSTAAQPPDGHRVQGSVTVSGRPQTDPEGLGRGDRRTRLYEHVKRVIAPLPVAQGSAIGLPLGDGAGMEQLVATIEPLFGRERALLRWVALRGALTAMSQLGEDVWFDVFPKMVGLEFFIDHATGMRGFRLRDRSGLTGTQVDHACGGLYVALLSRVVRYDEILTMTVEEVNGCTDFETRGIVNDAIALDFIALVATAELRLEAAIGASLSPELVPEPSGLERPGWYVEPLFSKGERYWDGSDWTAWVRLEIDGRYHTTQTPLR